MLPRAFTSRVGSSIATPGSIVLGYTGANATWIGPFDPGQVIVPQNGIVGIPIGDSITVTGAVAEAMQASDPDWWTFFVG